MTRAQSFLMGAAGALALLVLVVGIAWAGNILQVDRDGTVRMAITDTGNVGIGTANPSEKFHVAGKGLFTNDVTTEGLFALKGASKTANVTNYSGTQLVLTPDSTDWGTSVRVTSASDTYPNRIVIYAGGSIRQWIDGISGNTGIGTTDPKTKLHVTGLPEYANNAAALAAGLTAGAFYRTGEFLKVAY